MPKIKTHKATVKRFKITRNKKVMHRKAGQDHFNSRESGNTTRSKRRDISMTKDRSLRTIATLMPYNK